MGRVGLVGSVGKLWLYLLDLPDLPDLPDLLDLLDLPDLLDLLEQRVDERRRARAAEHDQHAEEQQHQKNGREPPLLVVRDERPELAQHARPAIFRELSEVLCHDVDSILRQAARRLAVGPKSTLEFGANGARGPERGRDSHRCTGCPDCHDCLTVRIEGLKLAEHPIVHVLLDRLPLGRVGARA